MGIRSQQNPSSQNKTPKNQGNAHRKSHNPLLGSRLEHDAPLDAPSGGGRAADLSVRYQHCPLRSVLQDSYLAAAHTDTPSSKGTQLFLHSAFFAPHILYVLLQNLSLVKTLSLFTTSWSGLYCQQTVRLCALAFLKLNKKLHICEVTVPYRLTTSSGI